MPTHLSEKSIKAFHAHLYFKDEVGTEIAKKVAQQAAELFDIKIGRFHQKPVGPHPLWSCQLSFAVETFSKIVPWLMFHRQSLDVFLHPLTGDDYVDHTQGISWLGHSHPLNLAQFTPK